jgi:formate/nitrite transporter FocA (FNT family)
MLNKIIKSIMAGIAISIGSVIYLSCSDKNLGALLFSVGILMVMEFKLLLFTGYVPTQRESHKKFINYILESILIFVGNILGGMITAGLLALTSKGPVLYEKALAVCTTKLGENPISFQAFLSVFILSIFCGFIIAGIVKATNLKHKVLYVAMMIGVFILCGFEHVVADSYYFAASLKLFTWEGLLFILGCGLGNFVGGFLCSFIKTPEKNSN